VALAAPVAATADLLTLNTVEFPVSIDHFRKDNLGAIREHHGRRAAE